MNFVKESKRKCLAMSEKQVIVILEDDFGRAMTNIKTELSPPQLIKKIMELFADE